MRVRHLAPPRGPGLALRGRRSVIDPARAGQPHQDRPRDAMRLAKLTRSGNFSVVRVPDGVELGRSISSRNTRRRVRLLDCPNPRLVCFMIRIVSVAHAPR
jgi:hypothetical protein